MPARNLAAIDLGTNSFHLIIVKVKPDGSFESLGKEKDSVRLGSGAGLTDVITPDATNRGISCLERFQKLANVQNAEIRAVATSAIREAKNKNEFIHRVESELGIRIEVISGYEEARLIYFGILQGLQVFDKKVLAIDIGGGSTEVSLGYQGNLLFAQSLKIGAVRLTDKFFNGDPIENSDVLQCKMFVQSMLTPLRKPLEEIGNDIVIGSSGTIQAIAQMIIAMKKEEPPRILSNYSFSQQDLKRLREVIDDANTLKKRTKIPGMDTKRADIIVAGSIILEEIFNKFNIKTMTVSDFALREGIILDTIKQWEDRGAPEDNLNNIRFKSVMNLFNAFPYEKGHVEHVTRLSKKVFDDLLSLHRCPLVAREYLFAASMLHEVGFGISHSSHHKHSAYIIRNSEILAGYNYDEVEIIALTARYHRKSIPKSKHSEFVRLSPENQALVKKLAGILRITDGLDRSRQSTITSIRAEVVKDKVNFFVKTKEDSDSTVEIWSANQKKDLFEAVFAVKCNFMIEKSY
ncbi:MAG: Ppx/GppA phosphatase family protein [Spirochaetota bacterium]